MKDETADPGKDQYYREWFTTLHQQITDRLSEFTSVIYPVLIALGAYVYWLLYLQHRAINIGVLVAAAGVTNAVLFFGSYGVLAYGYTYHRLRGHISDAQTEMHVETTYWHSDLWRRWSLWCWDIVPENLKPYFYLFTLGVPSVWLLLLVRLRLPEEQLSVAGAAALSWAITLAAGAAIRNRYCDRLQSWRTAEYARIVVREVAEAMGGQPPDHFQTGSTAELTWGTECHGVAIGVSLPNIRATETMVRKLGSHRFDCKLAVLCPAHGGRRAEACINLVHKMLGGDRCQVVSLGYNGSGTPSLEDRANVKRALSRLRLYYDLGLTSVPTIPGSRG